MHRILPSRPVDERNFSDWVTIDPEVLGKFRSGKFSRTHFSDILRFHLLAAHGGLWMDATICVDRGLSRFLELPFFTLRSTPVPGHTSIARGEWTGYFFQTPPGDPAVCFIRDCFVRYWKQHDRLVHYFLVDFLIALARKRFPSFRDALAASGHAGNNRYLLAELLSRPVNPADQARLDADTIRIWKLTWKKDFPSSSPDGSPTFRALMIDSWIPGE